MYVSQISIKNLRGFRSVWIYPNVPDSSTLALPNVTLFLGDNGTGKSTILKATALGVLSPLIWQGAGFSPYYLVRRDPETNGPLGAALASAELRLHKQDWQGHGKPESMSPVLDLLLDASGKGRHDRFSFVAKAPEDDWIAAAMFDEETPAFLLLAYPSTRRAEPSSNVDEATRLKQRRLRYLRVAGLFEENVTLMPLGAWLPLLASTNKGRHAQVIDLINNLLPDEITLRDKPVDGEYVFERAGALVPFQALSDGYRAYMSWVGDLLYHLNMSCPKSMKLVDCKGVVLIDEIDLHLHPSWQQKVIPTIAKALPNLQFILTSHSSLVAGSLHKGNIRVLREVEGKGTQVFPLEEEMYGRSADQLLSSELFGLKSTRAPPFVAKLEAVAKQAQAGNAEASLRYMNLLTYGDDAEPASGKPSKGRVTVRNGSAKTQPRTAKALRKKRGAKK